MHGNMLNPALRVMEESRHGIGDGGIAVHDLAGLAAGRDPYVRVSVSHPCQEYLTSFVGQGPGRRPRTSRVCLARLNHINAPGAGVEDFRERALALVPPIDNHGNAST
ncbi:hypothetical protein [Streptomyces sp. ICC4]|uniref:hypothetical protein n=1 Tax=Streptomyces sp. ICC4 TaxID=2099584 RepID=UPI001EF78C41|nr:hypothetical protein [Streptomyces sp. ICC4]